VLQVTLKGIEPAALQGKTVSVYGIFSMGDDPNKIIIPDQYVITPVKFEVK
jgi:predicted lipoprotein